jgi:hypothetical protein
MFPLVQFILTTVVLLLAFTALDRYTNGWTQKKGFFSALIILAGLVFTGVDDINNISFWLIAGLLMGFVYLLTYLFVLRFQLAFIPIFTGTMAILNVLKQGMMNDYPAAITGAILAIILLGLLSYYWYRKLAKKKFSREQFAEKVS